MKRSTLLCVPRPDHVTSNRSLSMPKSTNFCLQAMARCRASSSWIDNFEASLKRDANSLLRSASPLSALVLPCNLQCSFGFFLSVSTMRSIIFEFSSAVFLECFVMFTCSGAPSCPPGSLACGLTTSAMLQA
eukprot:scaffold5885_cov60-Phaeocystis_antarctica.AAC.2